MNLNTIIGLISVTTDKRWKGLEEKLRDIAASFKVMTFCLSACMSAYLSSSNQRSHIKFIFTSNH